MKKLILCAIALVLSVPVFSATVLANNTGNLKAATSSRPMGHAYPSPLLEEYELSVPSDSIVRTFTRTEWYDSERPVTNTITVVKDRTMLTFTNKARTHSIGGSTATLVVENFGIIKDEDEIKTVYQTKGKIIKGEVEKSGYSYSSLIDYASMADAIYDKATDLLILPIMVYDKEYNNYYDFFYIAVEKPSYYSKLSDKNTVEAQAPPFQLLVVVNDVNNSDIGSYLADGGIYNDFGSVGPGAAYNIGGNYYFQLRSVAYALSGTEKQFDVGYDNKTKAITITPGKKYELLIDERTGQGPGNKTAVENKTSKITKDGVELSLTTYTIGGNNFIKLRDLGKALDFGVGYDNEEGLIIIDTNTGYSE